MMTTLTKAFSPTLHPELRLSHTEDEGSLQCPSRAELAQSTYFPHPCPFKGLCSSQPLDCTADHPIDSKWYYQQQGYTHLSEPSPTGDHLSDAYAFDWPFETTLSCSTRWTSPDLMSTHDPFKVDCTQEITAACCLPQYLSQPELTSEMQCYDHLTDTCTWIQPNKWLSDSNSSGLEYLGPPCSCSPDAALTMLSLVSAAASALEQSTGTMTGTESNEHLIDLEAFPTPLLSPEQVMIPHDGESESHVSPVLRFATQKEPYDAAPLMLQDPSAAISESKEDEVDICRCCLDCQDTAYGPSNSPVTSTDDELPMAFVPQRFQRGAGRVLRPRKAQGPSPPPFAGSQLPATGGRKRHADLYETDQRHVRSRQGPKKKRNAKKRKKAIGDIDSLPPPIWPVDEELETLLPSEPVHNNTERTGALQQGQISL
ncbi:hypothetical protein BCV69DRAFT_111016 [Microstroma glucosiphilum]|uniref:Uncharacterized protein n=1 Tax=Pseudomicrostroma glucosiphilum TaxID=1684307 RepID=A0A316UGV2_9BASI|nr:hypothetical protein BCV69DRAFT_111016 [Pseudomicrostroma glucosiphilum]PWN23163.1 hypothetical protein BCV69DRAFT_111016 [Pseudomicrostroma glucosiphilum]